MKELSLNILDIAMNSVKAEATRIDIDIREDDDELEFSVADNGYGMSEEMIRNVTDPFCTTRKTRKVGLGIPFLRLAAEQTGGNISITSRERSSFPNDCGTRTYARFFKKHIDYTPLGDIISTVCTLIQGSPDIDFTFMHTGPSFAVRLSTAEMRKLLGPDVPLSSAEVITWTAGYLREQYEAAL